MKVLRERTGAIERWTLSSPAIAQTFSASLRRAEAAEGLAAFAKKRTPSWAR